MPRSAQGVVAQAAPPVEWMFDWVYADRRRPSLRQRAEVARRWLSVTMAARRSTRRCATRCRGPTVLVFGEDVGRSAASSA